jgi:hypothetical protein
VIVAIANKLERIAWAVLFRGMEFQATAAVAAAYKVEQQGSITTEVCWGERDERTVKRRVGNPGFVYGSS